MPTEYLGLTETEWGSVLSASAVFAAIAFYRASPPLSPVLQAAVGGAVVLVVAALALRAT